MVACRRQVQVSQAAGSKGYPHLTGMGAAVNGWFEVVPQAIVHVSCSS
jgi:hypothetical protein